MAKNRHNSQPVLGHDPLEDLDLTGIDEEQGQELPIEALGHDPFEGMDLEGVSLEQEDELFPMLAQQELKEELEELEQQEDLFSLAVQEQVEVTPEKTTFGPFIEPPDTLVLKEAVAAEIRPLVEIQPTEQAQADRPIGEPPVKEGMRPRATFHFPADFKWGVATAAHQVEGNNIRNDWWAWEQQEGHIKEGHKSRLACNWWRDAETDFGHAAAIGMNALRLSVEWSRIETRPGQIDEDALNRYGQMLQDLRARNIEPMVTLHHFTNPRWLSEQGGWEKPEAITYFARFVRRVVEHLGQYCDLWCTINEPNVYGYLGYLEGIFPPGQSDFKLAMLVIRHMLMGHAAAYHEIHAVQPNARVGLAHNMRILDPANPQSKRDQRTARAADTAFNQAILTTLTTGRWTLPLGFGLAWKLRNTLDWIGLNYYTRDLIAFDRTQSQALFGRRTHADNAELLDGDYGEFYPQGMFRCIKRLSRLGLPIYVTEHGTPDADDDQRPRHLLAHLHQMWRAIQLCYPVMGYYHWTLVDNFEWAEGWTLPFGLIELDLESQARTPRRSAELYAMITQTNAITPQAIQAYAPELEAELLPA
jgi:beta-glucosidase